MTTRLIVILFLLTSFCYVRTSDPAKKRIDKYKADIDKKLKDKKLVSKRYPDRSFYGGSLTGYYLNNKLVLITADNNVAYSSHQLTFYVMADTLVFVKEIRTLIKEPDEEYIEKHTDKNNNTDLSKLPLEIDDYNFYYFSDNIITDFELKSFNKKVKAMEDIIADKNKMIITHYKSHLEELAAVK